MKKYLVLLLICFCDMLYSQASISTIDVLLEPRNSRGYIVWETQPGVNYSLEVLQSYIDASGQTALRTILKQNLRFSYYKLDSQFLNSDSYYFHILGFDASGQIVAESDYEPACGLPCGPSFNPVCEWKCNGVDYAWEIVLNESELGGSGILQVSSTFDYFDPSLNQAIPFYEPMTDAVFEARNYSFAELTSRGYYYRTDVLGSEQIKDAQNNVLSGFVHFVGKKPEQYAPLQSLYTDVLSITSADCGNTLSWAISTYNNPSYHSIPLPLSLQCQAAFGPNTGGNPGGGGGPSGGGANVQFLLYLIECDGETYWANEFNLGDVLEGLPCDSPGSSGGVWTPIDAVGADIVSVFISRLDKVEEPVILDPSTIFNSGGIYVANTVEFESGLYRVNISFADGTSLPIVLEHDAFEFEPVTNSSFAELTIAPNPIENDWLRFNITVERRMKFDIQVLTLDGVILHAEKRHMHENTNLERSLKLNQNQYPYNQIAVKLIFEDGSTLQSIATKP